MTRDLRKYTSQTNFRLLVGAFLLLFVIGLGLIGLIYGLPAAITGLLCLLGALVPIGMVWLFMFGLDWLVRRANRD
jgi:fatty acid desaturase